MGVQSNYIVKVEDAKLPAVQKALKTAGIKVTSIIEVYKETTTANEGTDE